MNYNNNSFTNCNAVINYFTLSGNEIKIWIINEWDLRLDPEFPPKSDIEVTIQAEKQSYTGKNELEKWMTWDWVPRRLLLLFFCVQVSQKWSVQQGRHIEYVCFSVIKFILQNIDVNSFLSDAQNCFLPSKSQFVCVQNSYIVLIFCNVHAKEGLFVSEFNFRMLLLILRHSYYRLIAFEHDSAIAYVIRSPII